MSPGRASKATMKSDDSYNAVRLRFANAAEPNPKGAYVLYWMQIFRQLDHSHALNYALAYAEHFDRPLVIYEGLRLDYPWASRRLHTFVLEGMLDNRRRAAKLGLNYWPFVETPTDSGRGLLRKLAKEAVLVVTDDYPCFIIPEQTAALARTTSTRVVAVDGNSIVPLAMLGEPVYAAAHLRPRIHRAFAEAWTHRAGVRKRIAEVARKHVDPPLQTSGRWTDVAKFVASLPIDASVTGGRRDARRQHGGEGRHQNRSSPSGSPATQTGARIPRRRPQGTAADSVRISTSAISASRKSSRPCSATTGRRTSLTARIRGNATVSSGPRRTSIRFSTRPSRGVMSA